MQTASLPRNFSVSRATTTTQTYPFEWPRISSTENAFSKVIDVEKITNHKSDESDAKLGTDILEERPSDDSSATSAASFFMR